MSSGSENLPSRAASAGRNSRVVGVGGFVQIDVDRKRVRAAAESNAINAADFFGGAVLAERAVRIDGIGIPSMNALVGPGADARRDEQIDAFRIVSRVAGRETVARRARRSFS